MEAPSITLSEHDFARLSALVNSGNPLAETLEGELERASVLPADKMPPDVVRMYSTVRYRNTASDQNTSVTLVYPGEANINAAKVSVLAPIGAALIGLQVGQSIDWALPNAKSVRLEVVEVTHAETAGE